MAKKSAIPAVVLSLVAAIAVMSGVGLWVKSIREEGEANRRARIEQQRAEEKAERDKMFDDAIGR